MQCRDCLTDLGGWVKKGVTPRRAAFRHCREEPALAEAQADAGAGTQAFGQPFHVIPAEAGTRWPRARRGPAACLADRGRKTTTKDTKSMETKPAAASSRRAP